MSAFDIRALVAEILEQPVETVSLDSDLEALGWDSLADLNLISIADERFGITVDPQALADSETPADLDALLSVGV
jgi:acyl carrier protein